MTSRNARLARILVVVVAALLLLQLVAFVLFQRGGAAPDDGRGDPVTLTR